MALLLQEAILSFLPDLAPHLREFAGLPAVLCTTIEKYLHSQEDFETIIITSGLYNRTLATQLTEALLTSSNPFVIKWCSYVTELYRHTYKCPEAPRSRALAHALLLSYHHQRCHRPLCFHRLNCTCHHPIYNLHLA